MRERSRIGGWRMGLLLGLAAAAFPARPEPFIDSVQAWSALELRESRQVRGLKLSVGHAALTLASGDAAFVVAGGETVGVFFRGEGTVDYASVDPVEFSVLSYNVRKNTGLKAAGDTAMSIQAKVSEVLWLAGGVPLPELPGERSGTPLADPFAAHVKKWGRIQETPIGHDFPAWKANGASRPLVRAELVSGGDDLLYRYDALDSKSESLHSVWRVPSRDQALGDRRNLVTLSDQPVGRDRRDNLAPRFVLTDLDLNVTAPGGSAVAITAIETVRALAEGTRVLLFDLFDTRFAWNRVALEPRHLRVKGVFDEAGRTLAFDHRKDEVAVALPSPLAAGASTKLRFEIEGDILFQPGGDNYWELGVEPWFPQPDLAGQYYTVHSTVKVRKPFVPFAPGKTVRRVEEGEFNVLETRVDRPIQFMVILAGKYEFDEETKNGVTVRVASYGRKNDAGIKKLMKLTYKVIDYYEGFLGKFPFEEFNVVEIHSWGFGQAPPGFMFITSEAFNPIGDRVNQFFSGGVNERFSHEIAHQYWGHVVKMSGYEEQWLTESFAEISAGLFTRELRGKSDFEGLRDVWKSRAKEAADSAPIPLANRLRAESDQGTASRYRTYLLYFKGPWILDAVRLEIGDEAFKKFLGSCQATFRWKFGSTKTVQAVLEAITKKEWKGFFDDFYWGTRMPGK
jgi:hypothetical protein